MVFGELVRAHRRRLSLTQEELADKAGLNVRTIRKLEINQTISPRPRTVRLVAHALGLSDAERDSLYASVSGDVALPTPGRAVPAQLPADVSSFTGRSEYLHELTALLGSRDAEAPGVVVIAAICGAAGVGKTALAVHWSHLVRDRFPDGQLYVNLRGYDPEEPVLPADALAANLRALGVRGQDIPLDQDERAAAYRSLLAGRRLLVVLDNASSEEQVRPLLPGGPSCLTVVTSRDSLAGLVARDGAYRIELGPLPLADSVALLRAMIGNRVDTDSASAGVLAEQCARLPLALRVAAELIAARPHATLPALVAELADQQRRLEILNAGGDPRTAVRAVLSWSYQRLPPEAARQFRMLGLHPSADFDPHAAAALAETTPERTRLMLDQAIRAHLIYSTVEGRYGMHDLLRAYATDLALSLDGPRQCRLAQTRLFDLYLATAAAAMDILHPAERHRRAPAPAAGSPGPPLADEPMALAWLDQERSTLVAICAYSAAHGWPRHTTGLATILFRYLEVGGHHAEASAIHTYACQSARDLGDRGAEGTATLHLGVIRSHRGQHGEARDLFQRATTLLRQAGDRIGEARALSNLGSLFWQEARYPEAGDHHQHAISLFGQAGDHVGEAKALLYLGVCRAHQGRHAQALAHLERSLALSRQAGDPMNRAEAMYYLGEVYLRRGKHAQAAQQMERALPLLRRQGGRVGEAYALARLGGIYGHQARHSDAVKHLEMALVLFRQTGRRHGEALALGNLGEVHRQLGRHDEALGCLHRALDRFRESGVRGSDAQARNCLGEVRLAIGRPDLARGDHSAAMESATRTGDLYEQARACAGLGQACYTAGAVDEAREHWQRALRVYVDLGIPEAEGVRGRLAMLGEDALTRGRGRPVRGADRRDGT